MPHVFNKEKNKFQQMHPKKVPPRPLSTLHKRQRNAEYTKFLIALEKGDGLGKEIPEALQVELTKADKLRRKISELSKESDKLRDEIENLKAKLRDMFKVNTKDRYVQRQVLSSKLQELDKKLKLVNLEKGLSVCMEAKLTNLPRFYRELNDLWSLLDKLATFNVGWDRNHVFVEDKNRLEALAEEICAPSSNPEPVLDEGSLRVLQCNGDLFATFELDESMSVHDLKLRLADINNALAIQRDQAPAFHVLLLNGEELEDLGANLNEIGVEPGTELMLICKPFCETCVGECKCPVCHHANEGRYGARVHWRRDRDIDYTPCQACHHCKFCRGACRCPLCHGHGSSKRGGCDKCGVYYDPCWGGGSHTFLEDGTTKRIRDVRVGDALRTVKGVRRVTAIWSGPHRQGRTEVCNFRGVWITSHHPVIVGRRWVFPAEVCVSYPLHEQRHLIDDLYNFELDGHDDTLLLKGDDSEQVIVTCTLGKFTGERFGRNICTRRSTRCDAGALEKGCAQCDAVHIPGLDFGRIDPALRWRVFDPFPQVEWDNAVKSEFDYAEEVVRRNPPAGIRTFNHEKAQQEPAWKRAILKGLSDRIAAREQRLTSVGLERLCASHAMYADASCSAKMQERPVDHRELKPSDFGLELDDDWDATVEEGTCGICLGIGEVLRTCRVCTGLCCRSCLVRHVKASTFMYSHSLPLLACLWCGFRIPLSTWRKLGIEIDTEKAANLMTSSCSDCGAAIRTYVHQDAVVMATDGRQQLALKLLSDERASLQIWRSYQAGALGPREALDQLFPLLRTTGGVRCKAELARQMFRLVVDAERRMGLQLALVEICPEISCSGCQQHMCLKCHCAAHTGSCPPSRRMDSTCPSCGAGADLSAEHAMLLCVCGKYWEHKLPLRSMSPRRGAEAYSEDSS